MSVGVNSESPFRRSWAMLSWGMEIPNAANEPAPDMVQRCARDALAMLGHLAAVHRLRWTTESAGENALVISVDARGEEAAAVVERQAVADAEVVEASLDLDVVYAEEPVDRRLERSATLRAEYDRLYHQPADGVGRGVYLRIAFDVDIYARRTDTLAGDNRVLADLNAPRLNRFLRDVQAHFGQQFTYIEYEGDASQIDHNGFIGHDDPND